MAPDDLQIAELRAAGSSLQQIATIQNIDKSTVSRRLQRADLAEYVETLKSSLINEGLETAQKNILHAIKSYQTTTGNETEQTQLREHGFKASNSLLTACGLLPSNAPSIIIQTNNFVSPVVERILAEHTAPTNITDITPEDQ
jgi:hypothetical protein